MWRQSGFAFPVHIAQVNAVCQNAARKAGVRRCAGFVTISIMLLMDPAVDAVGGWTTRTMLSEITQRSPVGSRFAVSFCCFNKNENLYGGEEMLYTKV